MWHIYTMEYSSAIKKDEVMLLQQHGGPRECHTEWSKSNTGEIMYDISYIWDFLKKLIQMNLLTNRKRLTDLKKWTDGCGEGQSGPLGRSWTHCYIQNG